MLPKAFDNQHQRVILAYLRQGQQAVTAAERPKLLEGFDLLHHAYLFVGNQRYSFRMLYTLHVDEPFAAAFITQLLQMKEVARQQEALRATYARQIVERLRAEGLSVQGAGANLLLAYCLYFWEAFATGYAFEVEILRDLTQSGINYQAHDLRNRQSRLSAYDLRVLGLHGDIKTSLYFLHTQRGRGLAHDFYITRIYEGEQQRTLVVMLQLDAWAQIDGDTLAALLRDVTQLFPTPVQVEINGKKLVVTAYAVWKAKVLRRQQGIDG